MIFKIVSISLLCLQSIVSYSQDVQFLKESSNNLDSTQYVTDVMAQEYYNFFDTCSLFIWTDVANNCEDRANGASILLDAWGVPHYKIWIFNSGHLEKGTSKLCGDCPENACWGFHVATVIPYMKSGEYKLCVIDPATLNKASSEVEWAENITCSGTNYYMFTSGKKYMYSKKGKQFGKDTFWGQGKKNLKWTHEGLAGINGKNFWQAIGKPFKKKKITWVKSKLASLKNNNPI